MYFCFLFRTGMSPPLAHPGGRGLGDLRIAAKSESKPPLWTDTWRCRWGDCTSLLGLYFVAKMLPFVALFLGSGLYTLDDHIVLHVSEVPYLMTSLCV